MNWRDLDFVPEFWCCIFSAGDEVVVSDRFKKKNAAIVSGEGWEILERNQ